MNIQDQIALTEHTNRLQAAAQAGRAVQASLQEQTQTFEFAGCRFGGFDAVHLKSALAQALGKIAEDATAALKKGGVEFPDPPAANRAEGRRAAKPKKGGK